jgi:hypothetical protein
VVGGARSKGTREGGEGGIAVRLLEEGEVVER